MSRLPEGIEGEGLVIRQWRMDDAAVLHGAITANVEHLRPRMAWIEQEPLGLDDRRDMIDRWDGEWADGGDIIYGVWDGDEVVAGCGLHRRIGPNGLEIGYWTHVDRQGRGIATTLTRLLTDLAFTVGGIERVEIHHDLTNVASSRIPEKLGYVRIGEQPATSDQAPADVGTDVVWLATRADWDATVRNPASRRGDDGQERRPSGATDPSASTSRTTPSSSLVPSRTRPRQRARSSSSTKVGLGTRFGSWAWRRARAWSGRMP